MPEEGWAVHAGEDHRVAADVHVVIVIPGLHVELAGRFGYLFQHKLRIEEDRLAVDFLAVGGE